MEPDKEITWGDKKSYTLMDGELYIEDNATVGRLWVDTLAEAEQLLTGLQDFVDFKRAQVSS